MDIADIPGPTTPRVCSLLRSLAALVWKEHAIVEIGVYLGRSACFLGQGATEGCGAHVWAIDPWDLPGQRMTYEQHLAGHDGPSMFTDPSVRASAEQHVREAGLEQCVTLVRGFAHDVAATWDGPPVGLMFIDGDHRYDAVRRDFSAWRPHLAEGALVIFDDYAPAFDGVTRAVDELVMEKAISPISRSVHEELAITCLL